MTQPQARRFQGDADRDSAHLTAAEWLVRLRNPDIQLEDIQAWQAWMQADARHSEAFARMEELSSVLRLIPRPERPPLGAWERDQYDASVPIRDWAPPRLRGLWLAVAASVLIVGTALTVVGIQTGFGPWAQSPTVFATRVGENHTVVLADGSKVTLGGNSRMEVSFSATLRHIELLGGEAYFTVARDAGRPFELRAQDVSIVALGTEFNVRRGASRVVVAVTEGRVRVEPAQGLPASLPFLREWLPKGHSVEVGVGEQTTAGSAGIEPVVPVTDLATVTAWRSGRIAFRMQTLRTVLEDVNRYVGKPIVLGDEALGDLRVTGTITETNVPGWLASLENVLGLSVHETADRVVLTKAGRANP